MIIDPAFKGLAGPAFDVPIERGKVREFAVALGAYLPDHFDGPRPIAPPTFLVTAAYLWGYWLERPGDTVFAQVGLQGRLSLDGGQVFDFYGDPLQAGEMLTARTSIENIWEKTGRSSGPLTFVTIMTEFRTDTGALRATWRATSVVPDNQGDAPVATAEPAPDKPFMDYGVTRKEMLALSRRDIGALSPGDRAGEIVMPALTLTDVARYGFVSGEDGPSHHDETAARAKGFPTFFSIGMLHAGLLATYASVWVGPALIRRFEVRFDAMAWPGDVLSYDGTVVSTGRRDARPVAELGLACRRGDRTIARAKAVCSIP